MSDTPIHMFKATIPTYIYVQDGQVVKVVADDAEVKINESTVYKVDDNESWSDTGVEEDPTWQGIAKDSLKSGGAWPGWEWGW